MKEKNKKQSSLPEQSVLSEECQLLLEEIFAFFDNREAARRDPDLCLEAMLAMIQEDLAGSPITAMLQMTLEGACTSGAIEVIREEKKSGEFGTLKTRKPLQKEVVIR